MMRHSSTRTKAGTAGWAPRLPRQPLESPAELSQEVQPPASPAAEPGPAAGSAPSRRSPSSTPSTGWVVAPRRWHQIPPYISTPAIALTTPEKPSPASQRRVCVPWEPALPQPVLGKAAAWCFPSVQRRPARCSASFLSQLGEFWWWVIAEAPPSPPPALPHQLSCSSVALTSCSQPAALWTFLSLA